MWCLRFAARPCFKVSAYKKVTHIVNSRNIELILIFNRYMWPCVYMALFCCGADVSARLLCTHAVIDTAVVLTHRILLLWCATYLVLRSRVYKYSYILSRFSSNKADCHVRIYCTRYFFTQSKCDNSIERGNSPTILNSGHDSEVRTTIIQF